MPTNSLMVFQPFADTDRSMKPPDAVSIIADDSPMTDPDATCHILSSPSRQSRLLVASSIYLGVQPLV